MTSYDTKHISGTTVVHVLRTVPKTVLTVQSLNADARSDQPQMITLTRFTIDRILCPWQSAGID